MNILDKLKSFIGKKSADISTLEAELESESLESRERRKNKRIDAPAGLKVLIIDDSKTVCALLKKMLVQNKYNVVQALNAEDGLKIALNQTPDLIFLDIVLPGMSGFAALRALRKDASTKDVPIIMISGNALATEKYYAERIGADDFMKKPFSRFEVFQRIEDLIQKQQLPRKAE